MKNNFKQHIGKIAFMTKILNIDSEILKRIEVIEKSILALQENRDVHFELIKLLGKELNIEIIRTAK